MTECNICVSLYNNVLKKCVTCPKCNFECCRSCIEKYLTHSYNDFHCMSCKCPWDYEFVLKQMTKACVKRVQTHRENVLFEREKAKTPMTQKYILYQKEINHDKNVVDVLYQQYLEVNTYYAMTYAKYNQTIKDFDSILQDSKILPELMKELKTTCETKRKELASIGKNISTLRRKILKWEQNWQIDKEKDTLCKIKELKIICNCSENKCKGFIMSDWKCGTCETNFCSKCHIKREENHECKEDDIKTAALIIKSTRACPSCATLIHKINGCSQMWCPSCKTTFDYNTGKIDNGIIHNPHYYEWFRNNPNSINGNNTQNINCNRVINQYQVMTHINVAFRRNQEVYKELMYYNRLYGHVRYLMNNVPIEDDTDEKHNLDIRIQWMLNKIDDKNFKQKLKLREKKNKFNFNKKQIYDMTQKVMNDISHKLIHSNTIEEANKLIDEYVNIKKYCNDCLKELGTLYNYKVQQLN